MSKKSNIVVILLLIVIIVLSCLVIFRETENTNANPNNEVQNIIRKDENITNNVIQNLVDENNINDTNNENVNEKIENTISSETFKEEPKTQEEKAIEIVKKDYGESSNIKFSLEGINENGYYIVAVRDVTTTKALAFYTINMSNETYTKREMN